MADIAQEPPEVEQSAQVEQSADVAADAPASEVAGEPAPEPVVVDPGDELAARIDAARDRLRAKIAPPDPED